MSASHLDRVIALVAAGEYRADVQAKNWVGRAVADVLGLDIDVRADKEKVKSLIKIWIANGALTKEWRKDARRETREFIGVGRDPESSLDEEKDDELAAP